MEIHSHFLIDFLPPQPRHVAIGGVAPRDETPRGCGTEGV